MSRILRSALIAVHGPTCIYCGCLPKRRGDITIDHIVPRARGGEHVIENVTIACLDCNIRKGMAWIRRKMFIAVRYFAKQSAPLVEKKMEEMRVRREVCNIHARRKIYAKLFVPEYFPSNIATYFQKERL